MKLMESDNWAMRSHPIQSYQAGLVTKVGEDGQYEVQIGDGRVGANVALSCLVLPIEGDTVAVYSVEGAGAFIGLILSRGSGRHVVDIRINGDLQLESTGKLTLMSLKSISMSASDKIEILSQILEVWGNELRLTGERLSSTFSTVRLVGSSVSSYFKRVTSSAETIMQTANQLFRSTKTIESVQCGALTQKVSGAMVSQSEYAAILAKQDMRIDGARIHVG